VSARKIRALVTVLGLDQHEAGALAVSRMLRDAGIEVIYMGRFTRPETIAEVASQEDVDVVGISAHSWEFLYYAADLMRLMSAEEVPIPVIVGGSIVTDADRRQALDAGITEVVLAGASEDEIVGSFIRLADPEARRRLPRYDGHAATPPKVPSVSERIDSA
jgi:methylmalonyl-CoA mutase C-terminal domain/subunit